MHTLPCCSGHVWGAHCLCFITIGSEQLALALSALLAPMSFYDTV
jgi:hypothetical protein